MKTLAPVIALLLGCSIVGGCELRRPPAREHATPGRQVASAGPGRPGTSRATGAPTGTSASASGNAPSPAGTVVQAAAGGAGGDSCGGSAGGSCGAAGGSCGDPGGSCRGDCGQWEQKAAAVARRSVPTGAEWTAFHVQGMHCGNCERRVMASLGELAGVVGVEADAELGLVRVATRPGDPAARAAARERLASLGYRVND
jgi:copper chaperone CopZ